MQKVNEAGWLAILITNQAGVARGYFSESMIEKVHRKLQDELSGKGARLDAIYYCPHVPNGDDPEYALDCKMRKPYPGMILKAAAEHGVDLEKSVMLGDKYSDLEAGWRAGCRAGPRAHGVWAGRKRASWNAVASTAGFRGARRLSRGGNYLERRRESLT